MIGQSSIGNSGYYIEGGIAPRPFGQMRRGAAGKGQRAASPRVHYSIWISCGIGLFSLGLSFYSLHTLNSVKNQVLTERMVVLERFDESEETLRRVGAILNFLVKDKDISQSGLEAAPAETTSAEIPIAIVTTSKTAVKRSPEDKAETLMLIAKNSRLVVAGRDGEWLQVIAPTGERGWINEKDLVAGEAVSG